MLTTSLLRIALTRTLNPFVFQGKYQNKLDFKDLDHLGLYVHIPFCKSICSFCPYCKEIYNKDLAIKYKNALLKEISLVCEESNDKKLVTSLYFGGGTPALMIDEIDEIINKLKQYFIISGEIGVELHPDNINHEILSKLKKAGVSMLSVGIQSFNRDCLKRIGREDNSFIDKLKLIKSYNFSVLDVDLIFGIPGQNKKILKKDIETAFKYGATQISTYPFIDFTFSNNEYKPLSHKHKKKMLSYLNEVCKEMDLEKTSVWTFTKKETNIYSSVTRDTFLGFGVSATTLLKDSFKINTFSINDYIKRIENDNLPTSLTLEFTKRQRMAYYLFWSAYGLKISEENFEKLLGVSISKMYGFELLIGRIFGLLKKRNNTYYLTNKASYIYHRLEQQYTTAYIDKMWNISRKVPFPDKIILR